MYTVDGGKFFDAVVWAWRFLKKVKSTTSLHFFPHHVLEHLLWRPRPLERGTTVLNIEGKRISYVGIQFLLSSMRSRGAIE